MDLVQWMVCRNVLSLPLTSYDPVFDTNRYPHDWPPSLLPRPDSGWGKSPDCSFWRTIKEFGAGCMGIWRIWDFRLLILCCPQPHRQPCLQRLGWDWSGAQQVPSRSCGASCRGGPTNSPSLWLTGTASFPSFTPYLLSQEANKRRGRSISGWQRVWFWPTGSLCWWIWPHCTFPWTCYSGGHAGWILRCMPPWSPPSTDGTLTTPPTKFLQRRMRGSAPYNPVVLSL